MLWTIIDRLVNLTFLFLATALLTLLFNTSSDNFNMEAISIELKAIRDSFKKVSDNHLLYLENRINTVAKTHDDHHVIVSNRLNILEVKLAALETENKQLKTQSKIVNYNQSSAVINNK